MFQDKKLWKTFLRSKSPSFDLLRHPKPSETPSPFSFFMLSPPFVVVVSAVRYPFLAIAGSRALTSSPSAINTVKIKKELELKLKTENEK